MHLVIASAASAHYRMGRNEFGNRMIDETPPEAPRLWTQAGFRASQPSMAFSKLG